MSKGKVYLAGSMEFSPDGGIGWRQIAKAALHKEGWETFDPTDEEHTVLDPFNLEDAAAFLKLKRTKTPEAVNKFRKVMRHIILFDLAKLERSNIVLAMIDDHASGGTAGELTIAFNKGIPIIGVTPSSLDKVSGWLLGCIDITCTSLNMALDIFKTHTSEEIHRQIWPSLVSPPAHVGGKILLVNIFTIIMDGKYITLLVYSKKVLVDKFSD